VGIGGGDTAVEFRLGSPTSLGGQVIDDDGDPVAGVRVSVHEWRHSQTLQWETRTGTDGRFEWADAPADYVTLRFEKAGFLEGAPVPFRATDGEKTVTLTRTRRVVIRGSVIDAETREPVGSFTIRRGSLDRDGTPHASPRAPADEFRNGEFQIFSGRDESHTVLRVDADGYTPQIAHVSLGDSAEVECRVALRAGVGPNGTLALPDGQPLQGATVTLLWTAEPQTSHGNRPTAVLSVVTDADGRFSFPAQIDPWIIFAEHETGYVEVTPEQLAAEPYVVLRPWGRIEGVCTVGAQGGAGETIECHPVTLRGRRRATTWRHQTTTTDAEGRFVFEKVHPGTIGVRRVIRLSREAHVGRFARANETEAQVAPGQTVRLMLAPEGRPVTGRVVPSAESNVDIVYLRLSGHLTRVVTPQKPENWDRMSDQERAAWLAGYRSADAKDARRRASRQYSLAFDAYGNFVVDDAVPGRYRLEITARGTGGTRRVNEQTQRNVVVPAPPPESPRTLLDLGEFELGVIDRSEDARWLRTGGAKSRPGSPAKWLSSPVARVVQAAALCGLVGGLVLLRHRRKRASARRR